MQAFRLLRLKKKLPSITELFGEADDILFNRTLKNMYHVLETYLPDLTETAYNLRSRTHNKSLVNKTSHLNKKVFIIRMLYKDTY